MTTEHPVLTLARSAIANDPVTSASPRCAVPEGRYYIATPEGCAAGGQARRDQAWPRHVAAYILRVEFDQSIRTVARAVQRDPKAVRLAIGHVEDRRDDPAFDAWIDDLAVLARDLAA